jgi:hypothetical protein
MLHASLLTARVNRRLAVLAGALLVWSRPVAADHDGT